MPAKVTLVSGWPSSIATRNFEGFKYTPCSLQSLKNVRRFFNKPSFVGEPDKKSSRSLTIGEPDVGFPPTGRKSSAKIASICSLSLSLAGWMPMGITSQRNTPLSHTNVVTSLPVGPSLRRTWKYPLLMSATKKFRQPDMSLPNMVMGSLWGKGFLTNRSFSLE